MAFWAIRLCFLGQRKALVLRMPNQSRNQSLSFGTEIQPVRRDQTLMFAPFQFPRVPQFYTAAISVSLAFVAAINAASLPPRSGCAFIAASRKAFLTSSFVAGHEIASCRAADFSFSSLVG